MTYEIQHLPLRDEVMQAVHDLLDGGLVVPPMHVKEINVARTQFLQARVDGDVHGLDIVSDVVDLDFDVVLTSLVVGSIL